MATRKIILCTGANQGLGFSALKVAAERQPENIYILASRNLERGREAALALKEAGVTAQVDVIQLDVTKDEEISAAAAYVGEKYGRLDVLINNAGILRQPLTPSHSPFSSPSSLPSSPKTLQDLSSIRSTYHELLNTNLTSVAVVTAAFTPLLYKSFSSSSSSLSSGHKDPRVISVSSGLGSCANALTRKMGRFTAYGASKVGLNGLSVHLQVGENDRVAIEAQTQNHVQAQSQSQTLSQNEAGKEEAKPRIRYYVVSPGALKTSFSHYHPGLRSPDRGAEVIVRLALDDEGIYEGGTFWEFEEGEMRQVPW